MSENDLPGRLRKAREKAGFRNATEAARGIGVNVVTYTAHENGGREYDRKTAAIYGKAFGVHPAWLLFGGESLDTETPKHKSNGIPVRELDVNVAAGASSLSLDQVDPSMVSATWILPAEFLRTRLQVDPSRAWLVEVVGDAMYDPAHPTAPGSFMPGDRVIIDAGDRRTSQPGVFAIVDDGSIVLKAIEIVYHSDPKRLSLTNRNQQYRSYEVPATEVNILGRVKGRLTTA